jgi:hypothetical protein
VSGALDTIFGGNLDWLFWPPARPHPESAWLGHIPFAHWLVGAARPRVIVELGTHIGASYAAFCDAVVRHGVAARCSAVDTWAGDRHSGAYAEAVFAELNAFNTARFSAFSTLLRVSFDAALEQFSDGTIDLLHIDGFHTYDAVRHDFETWRPKLSDRAIVLLHDTAERQDDFGVWKYWEELRQTYRGFAFEHSHGLGVLRVGEHAEGPATVLFGDMAADEANRIRERFAALGETPRWMARAFQFRAENERLRARLGQSR